MIRKQPPQPTFSESPVRFATPTEPVTAYMLMGWMGAVVAASGGPALAGKDVTPLRRRGRGRPHLGLEIIDAPSGPHRLSSDDLGGSSRSVVSRGSPQT